MEVGVGPVGFDVEQQALIWAMWRRGDAIREMERTLGETLPRIRRYLRESGGMPPIPRRRRLDHLSLEEREEISRGIAAGLSARVIAGRIDRPSSTVSREIARNGGRDAYRALVADAAAFQRARRPKPSKLAANVRLRELVADKLDDDWSPQQIAQWLRREFGGDVAMRISHESIYRDLYMPSRKVFDATMFHCLRSKRSIRRPRGKKRSHGRGQIRNMISIWERPTEADTRQVAGHWEGDLVFGARPSAVATLVDRASRYAMVVALPDGNKADAVARALIDQMGRLPAHLRRSLTWDRGSEMAQHSAIRGAGTSGVLLRSAPSMAARHQREYEPIVAPVPAQERRSGHAHSGRAQHCRRETQPPPASSTWLGHSGRSVRRCRAKTDDACACLAGAVSRLRSWLSGRWRTSRARRRPRATLVRGPGPRARPRRGPRRMRRRTKTSDHL
jgi:IS30 family transposase